jgi:hypothetical protein
MGRTVGFRLVTFFFLARLIARTSLPVRFSPHYH